MSITVEESAVKRIDELREQQDKRGLMLRIRVEGGGCSGFQYKMELTTQKGSQDQVFSGSVLVDSISLGFLEGARISFSSELAGAAFKIDNPNATQGCGCGASFSL